MILDRVENLGAYAAMNRNFGAVVEFLESNDVSKLELGKHEIVANGEAYINVMETTLHPLEELKMEFHREYIDIQLPFTQTETIGWGELKDVTAGKTIEFNVEGDYGLFDGEVGHWITVKPGEAIVLFPNDVHAPCGGAGVQRKAVIKVRV